MARYEYKCNNLKCKNHNVLITITKPMSECSKLEYCEKCKEELQRDYSGIGAIKTGDGFKS
jgi:predicted nucleic acid-binding Zn ribbon protein